MQILNHNFILKNFQEDGFFEGYASVFDIPDYHNDVIVKGAFKKNLFDWSKQNSLPKMLWQHDVKNPIGFWRSIEEDSYGLKVKGQILTDIQKGREAYSFLKKGIINELSIGFQLIKFTNCTSRGYRIIKEVDLQEISLVTFAANKLAKITDVKDLKFCSLSIENDILRRLKGINSFISNI